MLVAGFDPGITAAGLALVELGGARPRLVGQARITTTASDPLEKRLERIWRTLSRALIDHRPLVLGIEEQRGAQAGAFHRGDFNIDNSKTMQVVGLAVGCALAYGVPVVWVRPQQAKIAVLGKGQRSAEKGRVKQAVAALCGLGAKELTEASADAAAIAVAAGRLHRTGAAA